MERLPLEQLKKNSPINREMSKIDYQQLMKEVGERLKIAFDTDSYSEIGRQLDIPSVTNVKLYVDGLRFPSFEVLARFRAKGYSLEWLFTGQGSKWAKIEELVNLNEADEHRIRILARRNGISYQEQINRLTIAALNFVDEINDFGEF